MHAIVLEVISSINIAIFNCMTFVQVLATGVCVWVGVQSTYSSSVCTAIYIVTLPVQVYNVSYVQFQYTVLLSTCIITAAII